VISFQFLPRTTAKRLVKRVLASAGLKFDLSREGLAARYLTGLGLEIGALHNPLIVPKGATVRYVDRLGNDELRKQYPELRAEKLVNVDIVADGETLTEISDESQDFVIANHFIEHCENPIRAVENFLRVLKPGGVVFLAVPDKRACSDVSRPDTTFEHLLDDYRLGPEHHRDAHFVEWARSSRPALSEEDLRDYVNSLLAKNYSIHFHTWTPFGFNEFLLRLKTALGFPLEIALMLLRQTEVVLVLRKTVR
jgi:SAM-dependent methyltransferase